MVSIRDVAVRAGVSIGTVSKYLNTPTRVAPETSKKIKKAVSDLGYVRNEAARQLRAGESRVIGLVALELNNPFFGEVADSIERRAAANGLFLSIVSANGDPEREERYIELFAQQRVFGMILASGLTPKRSLDLLVSRRIPTVLLDAYARNERLSSTVIDDRLGARWAVEHLIDQGCRRIAFIGGEESIHQIAERVRGAEDAVAGRADVSLEVIHTPARSVAAGAAAGRSLMMRAASARPDGVLAANDSLAMGIMQAITESGTVRVPDDLAIVGYDDIDFAASAAVPLSTVRRPTEGFGRSAVDLLRDLASMPGEAMVRNVTIQPELIVRASSMRGTR